MTDHQQLEDALVQLDEAWSQLARQIASELRQEACLISPVQGSLLRILNWMGPQRMSDIASMLHVTLSGCTAMVESAVEAGLVERKRDDADRRVVWIQLTEHGLARLQQLRRARAGILAKHLTRLEPEETQQLATLLGRAASAARPETSSDGQTLAQL